MSGRKTRNTLSSQDQELMILAAAELEFTEAGVRKANIDTVAARAGVSPEHPVSAVRQQGGTAARGGPARV